MLTVLTNQTSSNIFLALIEDAADGFFFCGVTDEPLLIGEL